MGNSPYYTSRIVVSDELDLCPLTPVFQLPVERVREAAGKHAATHEATLLGAGKAAVEDLMPVEQLEDILDALELPEETHVEFLARFGLKPSDRGVGAAYRESASELNGYALSSTGKVDPHEVFISLLAVAVPGGTGEESLQQRLEEKFHVMFVLKDPQKFGFLHRQGVLMLLAQLSKGVHRLAAFHTPSLTLIERFVERHNPMGDRWTPEDLATAVVCESYAACFAEALTDPVDLRYVRQECKARFDEVKNRVDALARSRSKKETDPGASNRPVDPWQKRTTASRLEDIRRGLNREGHRMSAISGHPEEESYDLDEGSEGSDLEEKNEGSEYEEEDTPLFELDQSEVASIWRVLLPRTDMDAIQRTQARAEHACSRAGVAFSKATEDENVREHPRYEYQQGVSSEDLPVIAAPAIAFEVLNLGNNGQLHTHHYKHLRWLCAEICPTYRGVDEGELLPRDPIQLFKASGWEEGDREVLWNPLASELGHHRHQFEAMGDPLPLGFRAEAFVGHAAAFALLRDRKDYEQKLREDFNKYDQDGSGTIERDEFETAIQELMFQFILPQTDQQKEMMEAVGKMIAEEVLIQVDEDNSGLIEYDEFKKGVRLIHKKFQEIRRIMGTSTSLMFVLEVIISERTGRPVEKIE